MPERFILCMTRPRIGPNLGHRILDTHIPPLLGRYTHGRHACKRTIGACCDDESEMETWKAINSVRVVREFTDRPMDAEHVDRILNAGRRAGSSKNEQAWAFMVIHDREHLTQLAKVGRYAGHLAGATVAIALVTPDPANASVMWDLGRAAQNMVLAAWELGIGSVPATVYDHALAHRLLGLPPDRRCDFLLSFGYPADPSRLTAPNRAGGRASLDEVVHEERW
jgi:nitroreductase